MPTLRPPRQQRPPCPPPTPSSFAPATTTRSLGLFAQVSDDQRYLDDVERRYYYDKIKDEVVYIVNTDGSLFSVADAPYPEVCHGNIFRDTLSSLKQSEGYLNAVKAASQRMENTCSQCQYYGICSGYFMGEATPEQRYKDVDGRLKCGVVKPVQEYIEAVLINSGIFDPKTRRWSSDRIKSKAVNQSSESAATLNEMPFPPE